MDPRTLLELLRASPDFFALVDPAGRVSEAGTAWTARLGFDAGELDRAPLIDLVHRDDRTELEEALARLRDGLPVEPLVVRVSAKAHPHVDVQFTLVRSELIAVYARDVAVDRQLEDRVASAERRLQGLRRQESVALLAGAIVHHLNNLFCVSLGYLKLLHEEVAEGSAARAFLTEVQGATDRAAELVQQLLGFARDTDGVTDIDPATTVRRLELLIRQLMSEQVAVKIDAPPKMPPVRAGRAQLDQLLVNLVFAAREAMPDGGELEIRASPVAEVPGAQRQLDVRPGPHVELAVAHRARPPRPEPRVRLIEPLPGWGARFGLAAAHRLAADCGGLLTSATAPDGAVVRAVYLPVAARAQDEAAPLARPVAAHGQETILVVEDEEKLRALIVRALKRHGYQILVAASGDEALKVAQAHRGSLDLLLTDVVMPGMSGPEVAAALRPGEPGMRILFMSGHAEATIADSLPLSGGAQVLEKPFRPGVLAQRVRDLLDRR